MSPAVFGPPLPATLAISLSSLISIGEICKRTAEFSNPYAYNFAANKSCEWQPYLRYNTHVKQDGIRFVYIHYMLYS